VILSILQTAATDETALLKNCYAISYISMAVFMRFLWHTTYTCDVSITFFYGMLPLARLLSERKFPLQRCSKRLNRDESEDWLSIASISSLRNSHNKIALEEGLHLTGI
jgi:hypothetical protein